MLAEEASSTAATPQQPEFQPCRRTRKKRSLLPGAAGDLPATASSLSVRFGFPFYLQPSPGRRLHGWPRTRRPSLSSLMAPWVSILHNGQRSRLPMQRPRPRPSPVSSAPFLPSDRYPALGTGMCLSPGRRSKLPAPSVSFAFERKRELLGDRNQIERERAKDTQAAAAFAQLF